MGYSLLSRVAWARKAISVPALARTRGERRADWHGLVSVKGIGEVNMKRLICSLAFFLVLLDLLPSTSQAAEKRSFGFTQELQILEPQNLQPLDSPPQPYTCERSSTGTKGSCKCSGVIDCENMKDDGVCEINSRVCSPTGCTCTWKKA